MFTIDIPKFTEVVNSLANANETYRETFDLFSEDEAYPGVDKLSRDLAQGYEPTLEDFFKIYTYVPHYFCG